MGPASSISRPIWDVGSGYASVLGMPALLDHPALSSRYFFPRPDRPSVPWNVDVGDATLACWRTTPHPGAATVVVFHGNGEVVADYEPWLGDFFASSGVNTVVAEYRGYGGSSGTPALDSMLDDVEAVVRAIGEPPANLFAFGRSVGSLFATHLVHRFPGARGLILESAIADPLERFLFRVRADELGVTAAQFADAVARRLDQRAKLASYPGPVLLLHTRHDGLVDVTHAERLAAWAGPARASLHVFDHGDHNSIHAVNRAEYDKLVADFVRAPDSSSHSVR